MTPLPRLAQTPWAAPIPGTRRATRIEENVGAADPELTAQDLADIDGAAARIEVGATATRRPWSG